MNMSNNEKLIALFLGVVLVAGLVESAPWLILLLIIGGMVYYANGREMPDFLRGDDDYDDEEQPRRRRQAPSSRRRRSSSSSRRRPPNADTVHAHALTAVQSAGRDPDKLSVLPVDIGLLAFKDNDEPVLHRTWPIEDDNDYIQPFVQVRVPQVAVGNVRFEITDGYGQAVFDHQERYKLERGRNLVIPSTRLPLHDEQFMTGKWTLRIYADDRLIANHAFNWETREQVNTVQSHIGEDGEINSEMRAVLAANRLEQMSLDDLLSEQADVNSDDSQVQRRR